MSGAAVYRLIVRMTTAVYAWGALTVMLIAISVSVAWHSWGETLMDVYALFEIAEREGRVGVARKSKLVDARAAVPGEVIVTLILGEGKETQSRPAAAGDMVVRNRCEATGNEEYLVRARTFAERYEGPLDPSIKPAGAPIGHAGRRCATLSSGRRTASSPSPPPGARRWWQGPAMPSSAIRPTPKTRIGSPRGLSRARTKSSSPPGLRARRF